MIYLDSAATSLLKPDSVQYAVIDAMNNMASPGRGAHTAAMNAADKCFECREKLAKMFHVEQPENVVFTFNATHGLNIAINSLVRPGKRVLTSGYEHNSVIRPLHARGANIISIATPLFQPEQFLKKAEVMIKQADVVVCTHVSNVFGYIIPIEGVAALCRKYAKPLIVDASQSAGTLELDFKRLGAEFAAMPGHKGLLAPQGTGVLLCKNEAKPLLYGGSGSESGKKSMPDFLPDRLEAGTHNVCGIAGLCAGVDYLLEKGLSNVREWEHGLLETFCARLSDCDRIKLFYSGDIEKQSGLVSALPLVCNCEELAERLSERGIAVRTGLHCAPQAHMTAGTYETGTVRFSFSPLLSQDEVLKAAEICEKILKNF